MAAGPKYAGATTIEEQGWCRWFGAEVYSGQGAIVELGPWLGSLTVAYCEGLERNPRAAALEKFAFAYDLFEWSELFEEWSRGTPHAGRFAVGESFEEYFRQLVRRYERYLTIARSDLSHAVWGEASIELLINDAAKSLRIADAIFRTFVPSMIPGASYVAHQDFLWSTDAYIQVFMFLARDSFVYEHAVPGSGMAVFRNVRRFDPARLRGYDVEGRIDRDLIAETFAWSARTLTDVEPALLSLCHAVVLESFGYGEDARRLVAERALHRARGNALYDFQLATLRSWGYTDLLPGE